jgi:hypothetical protein
VNVCDRHPTRKSAQSFVLLGDDSRIDLCGECKEELMRFLSTVPEPPPEVAHLVDGKPRKRK